MAELQIEDNEATRFMRKVYALRGTTPEAYIAEVEWASKLIADKLKAAPTTREDD